jgi:hypothetical protein
MNFKPVAHRVHWVFVFVFSFSPPFEKRSLGKKKKENN